MTERKHKTKTITYRETLTALTGIKVSYPSEVSGYIKEIHIEWPAGCNNLVQVAFGRKGEWLLPTTKETYLALNNATPNFTFTNAKVVKNDPVWLEIQNTDAINSHTISAIAVLEGVEYEEEPYE